ncbi:MAG TPA: hypothetical protein PKO36_00250 [Candidatus Hydrogenedentes bacterium]|nr:hypothetical protein [Candidatus Hydrogenedentota bacterium]HOT50203.1 hypothetical protein [Candidatus Hydrogenedentota bacterium]HPC15673.1 hypothetical protein [Candidatus Hydrogenedentota bacterium]HRT19703.1 hypothetical protein [Candidatus Hydrogenedentota bacterium]HRT64477.1 hypothetical protein [Candidatus Hydrogenedentota bacterium]
MEKGATICLRGTEAGATAQALVFRLIELGRNAERIDEDMIKRLGGVKRAAFVCGLLSRNGVFAVVTAPDIRPEGNVLEMEVDEHDTPDFAAEKILDELAERDLLRMDGVQYTPEEEEAIRKRLADLGYVE